MNSMLTAIFAALIVTQTPVVTCASKPNEIKLLKELCASTIVSYRIDCSPIAAYTTTLMDIEHTDKLYRAQVANNLNTTLNSFDETPISLRPPRLCDLDSDTSLYNRSNRRACDKCLYTMARNGITPHSIATTAGFSCMAAGLCFGSGSLISLCIYANKTATIAVSTSLVSTFLGWLCLVSTTGCSRKITEQCYRHLYDLPPIPLNYTPIPDPEEHRIGACSDEETFAQRE